MQCSWVKFEDDFHDSKIIPLFNMETFRKEFQDS